MVIIMLIVHMANRVHVCFVLPNTHIIEQKKKGNV